MTNSAIASPNSRRVLVLHVSVVLLSAIGMTVVLHPVPYILSAPLWLDELWVSASVHFPLTDLPWVTSTTPIGWNLLQQAFHPLGPEASRLLPLFFTALTPAAAYMLGYVLWRGRALERIVTGAVTGVAVACTPPMMLRNDLKQYTTDALLAIVIVTLVVLAGRERRARALIALVVVAGIGFLLSLTVVFVAAAGFAALVVQALSMRDWGRLRAFLIGGGIAGALILAQYLTVYGPSRNGRLDEYWEAWFPTIGRLPSFLFGSIGSMYHVHNTLGRALVLGLVVAALGLSVVFLWRSHDRAAALVTPILLGGMIAAGVIRVYPLFNDRTSTFVSVLLVAFVTATGVRFIQLGIARFSAPARTPLLWATAAILLVVVAVPGRLWLRVESIPAESTRQQVDYIREHIEPGDVILTNIDGGLPLAVYWPELKPDWAPSASRGAGWEIVFPHPTDPPIVRTETLGMTVTAYLEHAAADPTIHRIWIIETHSRIDGLAEAEDVLPIQRIDTGAEKLALLDSADVAVAK